MSIPRAAGGPGSIIGVGSPQYDFRGPQAHAIAPANLPVKSGVTDGTGLSMYTSANFATNFPISKVGHLHAVGAGPLTSFATGVYVFDIDPVAMIGLSFLHSMAATASPNNTTAIVRIWGMSQMPYNASECELIGHYLGEWASVAGATNVPAGSKLLPVGNTDLWAWADSVTQTDDQSISPGFRDVSIAADTIAMGAIDVVGLRKIIVACGQGAATPSDICVPILRPI